MNTDRKVIPPFIYQGFDSFTEPDVLWEKEGMCRTKIKAILSSKQSGYRFAKGKTNANGENVNSAYIIPTVVLLW